MPANRTLRSALWKCRRCSELNHTAEGGALVYRTRWAAARALSGLRLWQQPEAWEPLVFTSPIDAFELGFIQNVHSHLGQLGPRG
jgi:hypothetical protein